MKNLKTIFKSLLLILAFVLALLLALPKINFNVADTNVNFNIADDLLLPNGIKISDFRKGEGLYPTNLVVAEFPAETSQESVNNVFEIIKNRMSVALLGDVNLNLVTKDNKSQLEFEYPQYYSNPVNYTKWLTAIGSVAFTTSEETPQVMNINDFDINGEIKLEYSSLYSDHLSFYFNSSAGSIASTYFTSGNQYFLMYIDGTPSFYVVDFDSYIDTNLNRVRAISVLTASTTNEKEVADFVGIARSYFLSAKLPINLTVSESVVELPPSAKPYSLTQIALGVAFLSLISVLSLSVLRRFGLLLTLKKVAWIIVFSIINIALLKFVGVILSIDMLIGYLLSIVIVSVFIVEWENIKRPLRTLIGLILMFGFITKFYNINFSVGTIAGIASISLTALAISSLYRYLIDYFLSAILNIKNIRKLKFKKLNFKTTK